MMSSGLKSGVRPFSASRRSSVAPVAAFNYTAVRESIAKTQMKENIKPVHIGDTVKLGLAVVEAKGKTRTQTLEGVIIAEQSSGLNKTVTFRRVFQGIGIELTLPVHAPVVQSLDFVKSGKVRRAKLYYLRNRVGRSAKLREIVGARKVLPAAAK